MPSIYNLNTVEETPQSGGNVLRQLLALPLAGTAFYAIESLAASVQQQSFAYIPAYPWKKHPIRAASTVIARKFIQPHLGFRRPSDTLVYNIVKNQDIADADKMKLLKLMEKDWSHNWLSYGESPVVNETIFAKQIAEKMPSNMDDLVTEYLADKYQDRAPEKIQHILKRRAQRYRPDQLHLWSRDVGQLIKKLSSSSDLQDKQLARQLKYYRFQRPALGFYSAWQTYEVASMVGAFANVAYTTATAMYERNQVLRYYRRLSSISGMQTVSGQNNLGYSKAEESLIVRQLKNQQITKQIINDQGIFGTNPYQQMYM